MQPSSNHNQDPNSSWRSILREIVEDDQERADLNVRLQHEIEGLGEAGLSSDEAFLVALKRLEGRGEVPPLTTEQAGKFWHHRSVTNAGTTDAIQPEDSAGRRELFVVIGLALAAAVAVKIPELFGYALSEANAGFYARNLSFFVLPFLVAYFSWKRSLGMRTKIWIGVAFGLAIIIANVFPFRPDGSTEGLTAIHLPIALWLTVGMAYVAGRWATSDARMDFVRFSGELFIHFVLIALGGGVLTGLTVFLFDAAGLDIGSFIGRWMFPCGAAAAVVVAAGLTESGALTKMAPVLTRLFTPLFATVMVVFLATIAVTGRGLAVERDILVGFDLLLVLTLCLILYNISARDAARPSGAFDILQLVLVVSAILVDLFALGAIAGRISEFGFSANKTAAAGLNLILLVNLVWTAWLSVGHIRGRATFSALERWQTRYLTVIVVWAAVVAGGFPLLFGFA